MSLKELLLTRYFTLRNLFVGGNVVLVLLLAAAVIKDHRREWKDLQKEFYAREIKRLKEEKKASPDAAHVDKHLALLRGQGIRLRQIMVPALDRYDRCITCHLGYDTALSPTQETVYDDHPFKARPSDIHRSHPAEKFGCTVCHEGQGLATTVPAAHGPVKHWEEPMRKGAVLEASCAKCHSNLWDEKAMPFTARWRAGEALFEKIGCIGCHQIHGQGGPISVDLAEETADKPLSRIDFSFTGLPHEERTLENWIRLHFVKDPWTLVPGDPEGKHNDEPVPPSGMPFFNLSADEADALTTYVLSLGKDRVPAEFLKPSDPRPAPVYRNAAERGRAVYVKYGCNGCHGADAKGGIRNFNYVNDTTPNLVKVVGTYTRHELQEKIEKGVSPVDKKDPNGPTPSLYMPSWKDKVKGQEMDDLLTYLFSIAEKDEDW